jgi:hypothetical protein
MNSVLLFDKVSQISVYAIAALLPLWALPITQNAVGYQKQTLLIALALIGFTSLLANMVYAGEMRCWSLYDIFCLAIWKFLGVAFRRYRQFYYAFCLYPFLLLVFTGSEKRKASFTDIWNSNSFQHGCRSVRAFAA